MQKLFIKNQILYKIIIFIWVSLSVLSIPLLIQPFLNSPNWFITTLITLSSMFLIYFWLNGIKDIIYPFWFYFITLKTKSYNIRFINDLNYINNIIQNTTIDFIYCTYNDFNSNALIKSINNSYQLIIQNPKSFRLFILDDSTDINYKLKIDNFFLKINKLYPDLHIEIIRRKNRIGFKAGNINNWYYSLDKKPDFFIILDSDEIIPSNFITNSLIRFNNKQIGVVQSNHRVNQTYNKFDSIYAKGVESHWAAYQQVKNNYGFLSLLGHGAMVKSKVFELVNGFPCVVAEDLCFSINIRDKGYYVEFAPEIISYEEYPIDYFAFKKRHNKWTQGNMEFIKKYSLIILKSKMTIAEKLDILLFTYNLPLSAMFSLYLVINLILFPIFNFQLNYSIILLIPTILMLIAPLVNDFVYWTKRKKSITTMIKYSLMAILLYGSMFFISILSSAKSLFGKSNFLVTPKTSKQINILESIWLNKGEIIFGLFLISIAIILSGSIMPVIFIAIPSIASIWLGLLANDTKHYIYEDMF